MIRLPSWPTFVRTWLAPVATWAVACGAPAPAPRPAAPAPEGASPSAIAKGAAEVAAATTSTSASPFGGPAVGAPRAASAPAPSGGLEAEAPRATSGPGAPAPGAEDPAGRRGAPAPDAERPAPVATDAGRRAARESACFCAGWVHLADFGEVCATTPAACEAKRVKMRRGHRDTVRRCERDRRTNCVSYGCEGGEGACRTIGD